MCIAALKNCFDMPAAGYSGTALLTKLGIRDDTRLLLLHAPDNYFTWLGQDISTRLASAKQASMVHLFVTSRRQFEQEMKKLAPLWEKQPALVIWVSWYKKSAGMNTDITEDTIRHYALSHGLVDVKVCAVSELWSGLKLVVPLAKRNPLTASGKK
jgi:hypothetical protein